MRPKERIPIFLEKVNWDTLQERWNTDISQDLRGYLLTLELKNYWTNNPDLRFGQMLINLELMPDKLRIWNDEESEILTDQGLPKREFMFWGSIYDENRNLLPEIKYRLIKDMKIDHIKAILNDVADHKMCCRLDYLEVFRNEILIRK